MPVLNIGRREEIIGSNTLEYNMEKTVTVAYMKWKFNFRFENRFTD